MARKNHSKKLEYDLVMTTARISHTVKEFIKKNAHWRESIDKTLRRLLDIREGSGK